VVIGQSLVWTTVLLCFVLSSHFVVDKMAGFTVMACLGLARLGLVCLGRSSSWGETFTKQTNQCITLALVRWKDLFLVATYAAISSLVKGDWG